MWKEEKFILVLLWLLDLYAANILALAAILDFLFKELYLALFIPSIDMALIQILQCIPFIYL